MSCFCERAERFTTAIRTWRGNERGDLLPLRRANKKLELLEGGGSRAPSQYLVHLHVATSSL